MANAAVQSYVASLLEGLIPPGTTGPPLGIWDEPPTGQASVETPQAFVLDGGGDGVRQTMAGTQGFYQDKHEVYIYIVWASTPGTPMALVQFQALVDLVIATLRTSFTGTIFLTDPVTGDDQQTQLLAMAQKISWRVLPAQNLGEGDQEWLADVAQITIDVETKEQYVGVVGGVEVML